MAPNNFPEVLPPAESDQTREILQDPYALEFLALPSSETLADLVRTTQREVATESAAPPGQ